MGGGGGCSYAISTEPYQVTNATQRTVSKLSSRNVTLCRVTLLQRCRFLCSINQICHLWRKCQRCIQRLNLVLKGQLVAGLNLDPNLSMGAIGPQSPLDMKPDAATLGQFSPQGPNSPNSYALGQVGLLSPSPGSGGGGQKGGQGSPYPPNHPLSGSKHLCSICGDRASGKHYGVYRLVERRKIVNISTLGLMTWFVSIRGQLFDTAVANMVYGSKTVQFTLELV